MITARVTIVAGANPSITFTGAGAIIRANINPIITTIRYNISMPNLLMEKEVAIVADKPNMFVLDKTTKMVQLFTETESGARRPVNIDFTFLNDTIYINSGDDYDKVIIVYQ
jgi:hypothetical protein